MDEETMNIMRQRHRRQMGLTENGDLKIVGYTLPPPPIALKVTNREFWFVWPLILHKDFG